MTQIIDLLRIARGEYDGLRLVDKFGRNPDVDGPEDIWNGGGEYTGWPLATDNVGRQFEVFSDSLQDAPGGTGAQTVTFEYLDGEYRSRTIDVTLNGTTPVQPPEMVGWRCNRGFVTSAGSNRRNVGIVTVRHVAPNTADVHARLPADGGRTQILAFTVPADTTGYVLDFGATLIDNTSNAAKCALVVRFPEGHEWQTRRFPVTNQLPHDGKLGGTLRLPPKTDIKISVLDVTNANADITGYFDLLLASPY